MQQKATTPDRGLAYWDIESLSNIFMFAVYHPGYKTVKAADGSEVKRDRLLYFYIMDDRDLSDQDKGAILDVVLDENPELNKNTLDVCFMDLKTREANLALIIMFAIDNKPFFGTPEENQFRTLNTDIHSDLTSGIEWPYMIGYNSFNYDCTMISYYVNETWGFSVNNKASFIPTSAKYMRKFNNLLFGSYKERMTDALQGTESNIWRNMMRSGMFLDASQINDKVKKMPLKRIEGQLGMDIFEDDRVKSDKPITEFKDLCYLFAYNASDCIKLERIFHHKAYFAQYSLKKGLIDQYSDLVYKDTGEVRVNRIKVDDTSAKFAARILCPDGYLPDIRTVSYEYPKNSGRNILAETREWAAEKFKDHPEVLAQINPVFDYYGSIEGKNFDDSEHYTNTFGLRSVAVSDLRAIPVPQMCVPYFDKDGGITSTYVNFSVGGIHGAEFNLKLYQEEMAAYQTKYDEVDAFAKAFAQEIHDNTLKGTVMYNGEKIRTSQYVTKHKDGTISVKYPKKVELFQFKKKWQLNKKYAYCSDDEVDHDDFTSYYPGLLMQMQAYKNDRLGEDRYVSVFNNKTLYGKYMKDKARPKSEQEYYKVLREGTKLILNSASGASDTVYDTNIRMNNVIISMRIIGQLFTWRIGQALTFGGFKVTSTNTDGLYAACNDSNRELCRKILEEESANIGVNIEPEAMRLVSKDANNRVEYSLDGKVLSASGGDTACFEGPVPTKAMAHSALIDALLVEYLRIHGVNEPFSEFKAAEILEGFKKTKSPYDMLMLYQQIINSSESTCRYIFALVDGEIRTLQHNNRIFAVKTEAAHLYMANGWNKKEGHDDTADEVLRRYGVDPAQYTNTRLLKLSKIDPEQNMFIYNRGLDQLSDETARSIIDNIDDGHYIKMLSTAYKNWCNVSSHDENDEDEDEES